MEKDAMSNRHVAERRAIISSSNFAEPSPSQPRRFALFRYTTGPTVSVSHAQNGVKKSHRLLFAFAIPLTGRQSHAIFESSHLDSSLARFIFSNGNAE